MRGSEEMKETLRHKDAFEYYYSLGENRGLRKVVQKFNITLTAVANWSKAFHWQERVEQRDIEIGRELPAKTNETVLNTKANYRAEIKAQFSILKKMLNELIKKFKDNQGIKIKDITGLKDVLGCYEKLIRMDLTLMGEVSEGEEIALRDADERLFNKINSIITQEQKRKNIKRDKKFKR